MVVQQVVVVGAGYAGAMAANRLAAAGDRELAVTVINPWAEFVERIRLPEFAAGRRGATVALRHVLDDRVRLRVATVVAIEDRRVVLTGGATVPFDHLVYAVGSGRVGRPFTHAVGTWQGAAALRMRARALASGSSVVVVGGGLTAIESAAELAEAYPQLRVRMVSATPVGHWLPGPARAAVLATLARLGVTISAGPAVVGTGPHAVTLADGRVLASDCTVWAASFGVPPLAADSGLPVDATGRLRTDDTLSCPTRPHIVGAGDAVAPPTAVAGHLRMSCQAALPLGAHAADTVLAHVRGRDPAPVSVAHFGQAVSLGRRAGLIQFTRWDDTPFGPAIRGRSAALIKEAVGRATLVAIRTMPRHYRWPGVR
jgi:NADH:quinone reductase (non-electrogenic)